MKMSGKDKQIVEYKEVLEVTDEEMEQSNFKLLKPKQQRFTHMYLSGMYTIGKIAEILDVTEATIYNWLRKKEIKEIIDDFQREEEQIVSQNMLALRMKALNAMNGLLDSKVDGIKFQAAKDILDRTGFKPSQKQDVKVEIYNFEQQIKEIAGDKFVEADFEVEDD